MLFFRLSPLISSLDAEGCLTHTLSESRNPLKWLVQFTFRIGVHSDEIELLKETLSVSFVILVELVLHLLRMKLFLWLTGPPSPRGGESTQFLEHFDSYPLQSYKQFD